MLDRAEASGDGNGQDGGAWSAPAAPSHVQAQLAVEALERGAEMRGEQACSWRGDGKVRRRPGQRGRLLDRAWRRSMAASTSGCGCRSGASARPAGGRRRRGCPGGSAGRRRRGRGFGPCSAAMAVSASHPARRRRRRRPRPSARTGSDGPPCRTVAKAAMLSECRVTARASRSPASARRKAPASMARVRTAAASRRSQRSTSRPRAAMARAGADDDPLGGDRLGTDSSAVIGRPLLACTGPASGRRGQR